MAVKPIRDGFRTVTPYLFAEGASRLIDFAVSALDAEVVARQARPDGAVMHAELRIGHARGGRFTRRRGRGLAYVPALTVDILRLMKRRSADAAGLTLPAMASPGSGSQASGGRYIQFCLPQRGASCWPDR